MSDATNTGDRGAQASAQDPTMEDILASIRKILNEEEPVGSSAPPPPRPPAEEPLALDASMMVEPPPREPEPRPAAEAGARPGLVGAAAAAATASAVGSLVKTLAVQRETTTHRGGPTIEDMVREELRPMLREWLDAHLPQLVERLVRAEIERVVGRSVP